MVCVRKLTINFVDSGTGEIIRQYPFQITSENDDELYILLNTKKLVDFLSSFIRGCYKCDHLSLIFNYDKETIF